jgi:uncharacterized protein YndB with AHSA1/START domain
MPNLPGKQRTDSASRVIIASPRTIYQAILDPNALVSWLPPEGMRGQIHNFEPREGGSFRITLTYVGTDHSAPGKTSEHSDVVQGRFLKLVPGERIVQIVEFESADSAFAGEMTMTWSLVAAPGGTQVTIVCENVPEGIRQEDHDAGLSSTLQNLAAFFE